MVEQPSKDARELEIFRAFVASACLAVAPDSISHRPEPEPDMLCSVAGNYHYFELSEVLAQRSAGDTMAKRFAESEKAARRKAALLAEGKTDEANRIVTAGFFEYQPLLSFKQSLERKLTKSYTLHDRPCSLLLYYARQSPIEPFELLFDCTDSLKEMLSGCAFGAVWLFHHEISYSFSAGGTEFAALAAGAPVPMSSLSTPEQMRGVIGRISLRDNGLSMSFDARYSVRFNDAMSMLDQWATVQ